MSCEHCVGSEYLYYAEDHGTIACIEIVGDRLVSDLYKDYAEMPIEFCPKCGRHLTPPHPLTLKQLEEMGGMPVWVDDIEEWAICHVDKAGLYEGIPFVRGISFNWNAASRGLRCYAYRPTTLQDD